MVPGRSAAGAAAPLSFGEETYGKDTASSGPRGPVAGFKRLRATAGQGPNYVGPSCGYVGLCWPILRAMWAQPGAFGPAWGYVGLSWRLCGLIVRPMSADLEACVGPCWPMLSQKIRKMGTAKKHCKTQDILMVGGLSRGYVGPSWGYVGLAWRQCGPILGLCWPILGLCWPSLRVMLPHFKAMLADLGAYVAQCWPILSH